MSKEAILFAKFAGLQKSFAELIWNRDKRVMGFHVEPLIKQYYKCRTELVDLLPDLYSDLPNVNEPKPLFESEHANSAVYHFTQISPVIHSINYILEVRTNSRIGEKMEFKEKSKRIFITHGSSKEWYKVQAYLEKDLGYSTLELAQEANKGRTVLQKLNEEAKKCGCAVIVMTGDDVFEDVVRARENVIHEIGYFQAEYGLENVVLLHELGVNIPSNFHGVVYIPFPKNTVEATYGPLARELKVILT